MIVCRMLDAFGWIIIELIDSISPKHNAALIHDGSPSNDNEILHWWQIDGGKVNSTLGLAWKLITDSYVHPSKCSHKIQKYIFIPPYLKSYWFLNEYGDFCWAKIARCGRFFNVGTSASRPTKLTSTPHLAGSWAERAGLDSCCACSRYLLPRPVDTALSAFPCSASLIANDNRRSSCLNSSYDAHKV